MHVYIHTHTKHIKYVHAAPAPPPRTATCSGWSPGRPRPICNI